MVDGSANAKARVARSRIVTTVGIVGGLGLLYAPTLQLPFAQDDFDLLSLTWWVWLSDPLAQNGRPLWSLSSLLVSAVSDSAFSHRLANLILFLAITVFALEAGRRLAGDSVAAIIAVIAALVHPSFLWPVTWVSQRADLILILTLLLALRHVGERQSLLWIGLASAAKTPFIAQNLLFAVKFLRARRFVAAATVTLLTAIAIWGGYTTYYSKDAAASTQGLFLITNPTVKDLVFIAVSRLAKVFEGLVYVFVPAPAFAYDIPHAICATIAYAVCWIPLAIMALRNLGPALRSPAVVDMAAVGSLVAFGFAFGTTLRIYAPAILFLYLAISAIVRDTMLTRMALTVIVSLNLLGTVLNYNIFDFKTNAGRVNCYRIDRANVDLCGLPSDIPSQRWFIMRHDLVDALIRAYR